MKARPNFGGDKMNDDDDNLLSIILKLIVLIPITAFLIMLFVGVLMS